MQYLLELLIQLKPHELGSERATPLAAASYPTASHTYGIYIRCSLQPYELGSGRATPLASPSYPTSPILSHRIPHIRYTRYILIPSTLNAEMHYPYSATLSQGQGCSYMRNALEPYPRCLRWRWTMPLQQCFSSCVASQCSTSRSARQSERSLPTSSVSRRSPTR